MLNLVASLLVGLSQAPQAQLPFELVGNHIYLKGEAQGKPISILLDSGAGISVLDSDLAQRWNVPMDASDLPVSGAGAQTVKAKMLKDFKVKFAGSSLEQPIRIGIPLSPLSPLEGRPLEAVVGAEFFRSHVIDIDYASHVVRIYDPATYKYTGSGKDLPIRIIGNHPHLDAQIDIPGLGEIPAEAMIDTGSGSGLNLTAKLVKQRKLDDLLPKTPAIPSGAGVGGRTISRLARLSSLTFAGFKIDKPVASLELTQEGATGASANYDVLIGGDVMRRFHVVFDYTHEHMYLESNGDFAKPFSGVQVGLMMGAEGPNLRRYRTIFVVDSSVAKRAGVEIGDELVEFDGKPASTYTLWEIRNKLRQPGKRFKLVFDRNGVRRQVDLETQEIV